MRSTTNWLMELTPEEGDQVLKFLDSHKEQNHKDGYNPECLLCRATSRISLGRDYGYSAIWDGTKKELVQELAKKVKNR